MKLKAKLTASKTLARKLDAMGNHTADELERATTAGALLLEDRWKELARVRTGAYRRSVHTETLVREPRHVVVAVGTDITDPPYPIYLELGTSRAPAYPSARPAFDETKADISREISRVLRRRLLGRP